MDSIVKSLFQNSADSPVPLTPKQLDEKRRFEAGITYWLDYPANDDHELRDYLMSTFNLSRSQAYRDIANIKKLIGNYPRAGKEWNRHVVLTMLRKSYAIAERAVDPKQMTAAADKIGKYTRLDKEDADAFNWENVIPPTFEPTPDFTILNIKNPDDIQARKAKLMRQYLADAEDIESIEN